MCLFTGKCSYLQDDIVHCSSHETGRGINYTHSQRFVLMALFLLLLVRLFCVVIYFNNMKSYKEWGFLCFYTVF